MNPLTSWLVNKGVLLGADAVLSALQKQKNQASFSQSLEKIESKLDALIDSHYNVALIHLREGNLEKCKDALIQAIATDMWNLPARLLYCVFLCREEKYELALEYYWEVLNRFGPRRDIISEPIVAVFEDYVRSTQIDSHLTCIRYEDKFYPEEVYASLSGIAIKWMPESFWKTIGQKKPILTFHLWGVKDPEIIEYVPNLSIHCLTNGHLVYSSFGASEYKVLTIRGLETSQGTIPRRKAESLFRFELFIEETFILSAGDVESSFGGLKITRNRYDYETVEPSGTYSIGDMPSLSDGWNADTWRRHVGGEILISSQK